MPVDAMGDSVNRSPADRARHRAIRERLDFPSLPSAEKVVATIDSLIEDGLLPHRAASVGPADIAELLRQERERQGLSPADVAARAGWKESEVVALESGGSDGPTVQVLSVWARALGKRLHVHLLDG
ncbi:MAG: helix-turn-helix transcriptional regulator [Gemmataceae bacterium]|nr:helix-turn-helix transcriptional regulator [Gemmataceae bacterium]